MEPVFHLPYSEFEALSQFGKLLSKSDGYGMFIPASRQQEGVDFLILNNRTGKIARIQVKSSRTYVGDESPRFEPWYNNFVDRYRPGSADWYAFTALYASYKNGKSVRGSDFWRTLILVFEDKEMPGLLSSVRTKSGKPDRFFSFGFDDKRYITGTRGFRENLDFTGHLLEHRIGKIKGSLR